MTPDLVIELAIKSGGVAVGVFLGVLFGLSMRAKTGNTAGLFRGSVYATAFLASMISWVFVILIRALFGA
jgi:hypothetical protein